MSISARAALFAKQMHPADPAAFETAPQLDADDRASLATLIQEWIAEGKPPSRTSLLAFVADDSWNAIITTALNLSSEPKSQRPALDVLDEAALQVPHALSAQLANLAGSAIAPSHLRSWERRTNEPRTPTLHLIFDRDATKPRFPHPTQGPANAALPRLRFGGACESRCGFCHQPLHHLLTFEANAIANQPKRIVLATCLSCLGWEQPLGEYTLSFRHDANGLPDPIAKIETPLTPQFPARAFRELEVGLMDAGPRFAFQNWGNSNHSQNLHRIGGEPTWVQSDETLACPSCTMPMRFLLQLDSNLPQEDGHEFLWGSGGVLYVQFCDACTVSSMFWQCT